MIAVIFEVEPDPARRRQYLDTARALHASLQAIDGFISVERYASLADPGRLLSLSFWRDEEAVARWRTLEAHRAAQVAGRGGVFLDYRLRVARVVRDYGLHQRAQAPQDSRISHADDAAFVNEAAAAASGGRPVPESVPGPDSASRRRR